MPTLTPAYYCAATVRLRGTNSQYSLWTRRIPADDFSAARDAAKAAIDALGLEWAELNILNADTDVLVIR